MRLLIIIIVLTSAISCVHQPEQEQWCECQDEYIAWDDSCSCDDPPPPPYE